jgi:hypothetical protein
MGVEPPGRPGPGHRLTLEDKRRGGANRFAKMTPAELSAYQRFVSASKWYKHRDGTRDKCERVLRELARVYSRCRHKDDLEGQLQILRTMALWFGHLVRLDLAERGLRDLEIGREDLPLDKLKEARERRQQAATSLELEEVTTDGTARKAEQAPKA